MSNSMTRQHFRAVANFISEIDDPDQRRRTCQAAIRYLSQFNSNFNRSRFEDACDLERESTTEAEEKA